ncbi:glycoside hydrolase family 9 protein [Nostoc ellipsosporum NOK]|nr:glycoside hydrolase family 9 protein [Nostoc ellipsosporum NOK]
MKPLTLLLCTLLIATVTKAQQSWIRINQLGYLPDMPKGAVWCAKGSAVPAEWSLHDARTGAEVTRGNTQAFGAYGPFTQTARLDFSFYKKTGTYYLKAGDTKSATFAIDANVYNGAADFCLRYMRQQRCGFNPFLNDSCHTQDGYVRYGQNIPDSSYVDARGGWHDASDYLQYVTTSANAVHHLLLAGRDFPSVFTDKHLANGRPGSNGHTDVMDEARWGLEWLNRMYPGGDTMYNQVADDRDHISMRIPKEDTQYGKGFQRPVYRITGEPQQQGKGWNKTTGTSSTAAKIAAGFGLAQQLNIPIKSADSTYEKALGAYRFALKQPGVTQTVSVKAPYIYAEENWMDDMEMAGAALAGMLWEKNRQMVDELLDKAVAYAIAEPVTPWLGADTAAHYQWYPFINTGHYELTRLLHKRAAKAKGTEALYWRKKADMLMEFYRTGIEKVWERAQHNAFYRGVPFIWCSNNLTTSFAIQCFWYRTLSGDSRYGTFEQANIDWLFGCNPWGTSMVYGLPANGDTPADPHSAFTHLKKYPIDGGLVDGPVYTSIYKSLIGIKLQDEDEYAPFQSDLAVYHDDYGDYSTNEPTMDGTASLVYLLASREARKMPAHLLSDKTYTYGAVTRGDTQAKKIALVFTADDHADGAAVISKTLAAKNVKASFFLTGNFYRKYKKEVQQLKRGGHYLGPHSDAHLLYCTWDDRDSLLVTEQQFFNDLEKNYDEMEAYGIRREDAAFFLPPYEWHNDTIAAWTKKSGLQLINFTPGTRSNADYTWPSLSNYLSSQAIYDHILRYEKESSSGLNGFILLLHLGTDPARKDKFYRLLPALLDTLKKRGYDFQRVDELL